MLKAIREFFSKLKAKVKGFFSKLEAKFEHAKDELEEKIKVEKDEAKADEKLEKAEEKLEKVKQTAGPDSVSAIEAKAQVEVAEVEHAAAKTAKKRVNKKKK